MLPEFNFEHIGIATSSLEKTAEVYINAGYSMSVITFDPIQNVRISFLTKSEMPTIELLEPVDETSPVTKTIEKSGVSPYHMCYSVNNIEDCIIRLKVLKYIPLFKPVKAIAMGNRKICFLFNKDIGLIEIVERV